MAAVDLCGAGAVDRGRHEVLDAAALDAYRRRIRDLDAEVAGADADADLWRAERLRLEREALVAELSGSLGMAGRIRAFGTSQERARTAVRKAVKRAIATIAATEPDLGAELRSRVSTGCTCRYAPESNDRYRWAVQRDGEGR